MVRKIDDVETVSINTIIFDLSEVFISGLLGVDVPLSELLGVPVQEVHKAFDGQPFVDVLCGRITEQEYINFALSPHGWQVSVDSVKEIIRQNFHHFVPGMVELLPKLKENYDLVLLSDHAVEWMDYIHSEFPFFEYFDMEFFSYELHQLKSDPTTFQIVLDQINRQPMQCLFVDDNPLNVQNAETMGIRGIVFESVDQLREDFSRSGIFI